MKALTTLIILLIFSGAAIAQESPQKQKKPNKEKIKAMKISFLTNKLDLTPEEAQQFWPIYNEYENKKEALRKEKRMDKRPKGEDTKLSDDEIDQRMDNYFKIRQKELDLDKEYHAKFKTVIPIKKVGKLYLAQEEFKRELLRKIRNHKRASNEHKGPPPH
jgi:hypothetical protein